MLSCQRSLFSMSDDCIYLNGAYMSPQLKCVQAAGHHALSRKNQPERTQPEDFFKTAESVKSLYADLINVAEPGRIALIPAVSYGIATVAKNLPLRAGQNIVLTAEQFPSNYYSWDKLAQQVGAELRMVPAPDTEKDRSSAWNEAILDAIDANTALVACGNIHWADGTLFDLLAIRKATKAVGAWLVIDGTQSVGALPFDVAAIQPDALICAAYKWLMGPYSTAVAYYGPVFDDGEPLEENWINRADSQDFRNLVNYRQEYRPLAGRYSVGEQSNFMLLPMMEAAFQQLRAWGIANIQDYCREIGQEPFARMEEMGVEIAPSDQRAHHLVGLRMGNNFSLDRVKALIEKHSIKVSIRGDAIRVSPNVYNDRADLMKLADCLAEARMPKFV